MNDTFYIGAAILMTVAGGAAISRRECFDVPEGHCGLLYLHGRSLHRLSPGRHWFWKPGYTMHLVDMRKAAKELADQEVVTADQVGLRVSAVLTYQIIQAEIATHEVQDHMQYLQHLAQLAIRSVIGETQLEQLLHRQSDVGCKLLAQVTPAADKIGIVIHALELKEWQLSGEPKLAASLAS